METIGDYKHNLVEAVFTSMINSRLENSLIQRHHTTFMGILIMAGLMQGLKKRISLLLLFKRTNNYQD
jgi:hypothetical protein